MRFFLFNEDFFMATQLQQAQKGIITPEMAYVAEKEDLSPELVKDTVAAGKAVIPANTLHLETNLQPAGIGRIFSVKVNANIGTSSVSSSIDNEIEKMTACIDAGADAMMDLSTGGDLDEVRKRLIAKCPVAFGTVPVYEVIVDRDVEDIDYQTILKVAEKQAKQGVDFFTIHAGLLRKHLPLLNKRVAGIVSRGGALMAKWMLTHNKENPMYEIFDDLCDIMKEYDVCFSLGDGLRPGCLADATDEAQLAELRTLGELTERAQQKGCQVMVEGPGHVPFDQIKYNMDAQNAICNGAPFYVLGPLVTDLGAGYDHITSAIGGTAAATYGASFLCYVTPREHLGLPTVEDARRGVVAAKIAAHAGDVARGFKGARDRDEKLSVARANLDWETHLAECIDPVTAKKMHQEACKLTGQQEMPKADYCSMCGQQWCSVRTNKEIRKRFA